jgi:hypothetical protein
MGRHTVAVLPGWALSSGSLRRIDLPVPGVLILGKSAQSTEVNPSALPRIGIRRVEYLLSAPPSGDDGQRFNELIL